MSTAKKRLIITFIPVIVILSIAVFYVIKVTDRPSSSDITSNKKDIILTKGTELTAVHDGMAISGKYSNKENQALFYTATTPDKKLVGSGTILADANGVFSRNLSLSDTENIANNTPLAIKLYVQTSKGDITDELRFTTAFKKE